MSFLINIGQSGECDLSQLRSAIKVFYSFCYDLCEKIPLYLHIGFILRLIIISFFLFFVIVFYFISFFFYTLYTQVNNFSVLNTAKLHSHSPLA